MIFESIQSEACLDVLLDSVYECDMTRGQFSYGLYSLVKGSTKSDELRFH